MTRTFSTRLRSTSLAMAVLAFVGIVAAGGVAALGGPSPSIDGHAHQHGGADLALPHDDESDPPALPEPGELVGVLDIGGTPLVGPNGEVLSVPLRPPAPRLPGNADDVYTPNGATPSAGVREVGLLEAHAVTLNEVANDEQYSLVERFDLFRANGLITSSGTSPAGADAYRAVLATFQQHVSSNDPAGCTSGATALLEADGLPDDLVAGVSRVQLYEAVVDAAETLACP